MLNKKARRIIENIYDILLSTEYKEEARKQIEKDIEGKNVSLDKSIGRIEIQDTNGEKVLYTISIRKGGVQ